MRGVCGVLQEDGNVLKICMFIRILIKVKQLGEGNAKWLNE